MKTLYIIRHAKSDWDDPTLDDFHRTLNKRGRRDAPFMGDILAKQGVRPDHILSSTAVRALRTAESIAEQLAYTTEHIQREDDLYLADVRTLLEYINSITPEHHCVILVAHNPGVSELVEYLTGENHFTMPTCGIACISFSVDDWALVSMHSGTLAAFEYPKKYFPTSQAD